MASDVVDVYEHDPVYFALNEFEQHEQVSRLIDRIASLTTIDDQAMDTNEKTEVERIYDQFQYILNQYQEQPQLLDSYLPAMINKLLHYIEHGPNPDHIAGALLHHIIKVRGFKVMAARFLPHEPHHLIVVLKLIDRELASNSTSASAWATLYSLLVWLGTTCMVPLDLCRFDSKSSNQTTMSRVLDTCKQFLYNSIYMRMVAFVIGHFMSRQDSIRLSCLNDFLTGELMPILNLFDEKQCDENDVLRINAALLTLSYIFKFGQRLHLLPFVDQLYRLLVDRRLIQAKRIVIRRMAFKLLQKFGMTLLPMPQHGAAWRYRRGVRNLHDSLSSKKNVNAIQPATTTTTLLTIQPTASMNGHSEHTENGIEEDNSNVSPIVESILDLLMAGLSDKELFVRWSSAKGLGRITNRLRKSYATQLVSLLCDRISTVALLACDHFALQGGCLALAELARRGLLLPERLDSVMPIVHKSLNYDVKLGHQTYGHVVRDAACYVCWAFARAFDPLDLRSYTADLACMLLCIICFDWNVQCRRAASAALQENVGRQGQYFPHGIDIIQQTDYGLVGKFDYCFLTLAYSLAKYYDIYGRYMIDHLLKYKVIHWKKETRLLSGQLLEKTTMDYGSIDEIYQTMLLPLFERCLDKKNDGMARHGLLISCGHIIFGLYQRHQKTPIECKFIPELRVKISSLLGEFKSLGFLEGYSGDLIRPALCSFIANVSRSIDYLRGDNEQDKGLFSTNVIDNWQIFIDECVSNLDEDVRKAGLDALEPFAKAFYVNSSSSHLIDRYLAKIASTSQEHIRQGFASAIVSLPTSMLLTSDDQGNITIKILDRLLALTSITNQTQHLIQQRKDALIALCRLYEIIRDCPSSPINNELFGKLLSNFIRCTRDYTNDRFGDSGRLVRETACAQLVRLLQLVNESPVATVFLTSTRMRNSVCGIIANLCSKIDELRMVSGRAFIQLLQIPFSPSIEYHNELKQLFTCDNDDTIDWRNPQIVFPLVVQLLAFDVYRTVVWKNCLMTAGESTVTLLTGANQALHSFLLTHKHNQELIELLLQDLENLFADFKTPLRIYIPCVQACERLLSQATFQIFYATNELCFIQHWTNIVRSIEQISQIKLKPANNPTPYLSLIKFYCALLQFNRVEFRHKILCILTNYFLHHFPWVRRQAAQHLYDTCVMFGDELFQDDNENEQVMGLLTDTDWDQRIEELTSVRKTLLDLFHVIDREKQLE